MTTRWRDCPTCGRRGEALVMRGGRLFDGADLSCTRCGADFRDAVTRGEVLTTFVCLVCAGVVLAGAVVLALKSVGAWH